MKTSNDTTGKQQLTQLFEIAIAEGIIPMPSEKVPTASVESHLLTGGDSTAYEPRYENFSLYMAEQTDAQEIIENFFRQNGWKQNKKRDYAWEKGKSTLVLMVTESWGLGDPTMVTITPH